MLNKELFTTLDLKRPSVWLATWFGCGLSKHAPGTVGTIGALPFAIFLAHMGLSALISAIIVICILGWWSAAAFDKHANTHDSGAIVIDEVAGLWITFLFIAPNALQITLAFFLFRFFDVLKPFPISWCDKNIKGASGVMIDDILAGLAAGLLIWGVNYAGLI